MQKLATILRVFLASPSDLDAERKIVGDAIQRLNRTLSDTDVQLKLLSWETHAYPRLGSDPQDIINEQIGDDYDIFVGLMWTRFGTPTPRAGSGTEEEFNRAVARSASKEMQILFYFKEASPVSLSRIDPVQLGQVRAFKKKLQSKGVIWSFNDPPEFQELIFDHLLRHAKDFRKTWGFRAINETRSCDTDSSTIPAASVEVDDGHRRRKIEGGITVYPSKKVFARLKFSSEYKQAFTVRYPVIKGIGSESVLHKINDALSYENVFGISIKEAIEGDMWLYELDYAIEFIKKPFLNLILTIDGSGAYPSRVTQSVVVNYETGDRVRAADLFNQTSLVKLASVVNEFVQADMKSVLLRAKYGYSEIPLDASDDADKEGRLLEERFGQRGFETDDLNHFSISESGIHFIYNFGLPHAIRALAPEGWYYFEHASLKQFIKKGGVLDNFCSFLQLPDFSRPDIC